MLFGLTYTFVLTVNYCNLHLQVNSLGYHFSGGGKQCATKFLNCLCFMSSCFVLFAVGSPYP